MNFEAVRKNNNGCAYTANTAYDQKDRPWAAYSTEWTIERTHPVPWARAPEETEASSTAVSPSPQRSPWPSSGSNSVGHRRFWNSGARLDTAQQSRVGKNVSLS